MTEYMAKILTFQKKGAAIGGLAGAGVLGIIASGQKGFSFANGFAANGYGAHSPGKYAMLSAFICEVVMTFFFLWQNPLLKVSYHLMWLRLKKRITKAA